MVTWRWPCGQARRHMSRSIAGGAFVAFNLFIGGDVPMGRPGEPAELALAYVYLAADDRAYVTGQRIHVNGTEVING